MFGRLVQPMVDTFASADTLVLVVHEGAYMDCTRDVLQSYQDALQLPPLESICIKTSSGNTEFRM